MLIRSPLKLWFYLLLSSAGLLYPFSIDAQSKDASSNPPQIKPLQSKPSSPEAWSAVDRHRFNYYLHRLTSTNYKTVEESLEVLHLYHGPEAYEAVPILIRAIQGDHHYSHKHFMELIAKYSSAHPDYIAYCQLQLERHFTTEESIFVDKTEYFFMLKYLEDAGPAASSALPVLFKWLQHKDTAYYRPQVKRSIAGIGKNALAELLKMIEQGDIEDQILALEILIHMKAKARDAFPLLLDKLMTPTAQHTDPSHLNERFHRLVTLNATTLAVIARHDPHCHLLLNTVYRELTEWKQSQVLTVLQQIPAIHPEFFPHAIRSVIDPRHQFYYRLHLLSLLKRFHEHQATALEQDLIASTFLQLGATESNRLGLQAMLYYASFTPDSPAYFSLLRQLAQHEDSFISHQALSKLSRYPTALVPLTAFLEEEAKSKNGNQALALLCLSRLPKTGHTYLPLIRQALHSSSPSMQEAALKAITHLGPQAAPLLEDLLQLARNTEDEDYEKLRQVVFSLMHLKQALAPAVTQILELVEDQLEHHHRHPWFSPRMLAIAGQVLIPELINRIENPDLPYATQRHYVLTLGHMTEKTDWIASYLLKRIEKQESWYSDSDEYLSLLNLGPAAQTVMINYTLKLQADDLGQARMYEFMRRYARRSPELAIHFLQQKHPILQKAGQSTLLFHVKAREPWLLQILQKPYLENDLRLKRKYLLTKAEEKHIQELVKILMKDTSLDASLKVIIQLLTPYYGEHPAVTEAYDQILLHEHGNYYLLRDSMKRFFHKASPALFSSIASSLGDEDPSVQADLFHLIHNLRYSALPLLPLIQEQIEKKGAHADSSLVDYIALMGQPALPVLIDYLNSPVLEHRLNALLALFEMDGDAFDAIPHVRKLLHHRLPSIQHQALLTLSTLIDDRSVLLPELIPHLNHPDPSFRAAVVNHYKRSGHLYSPAVPLMIEIINDPDERVSIRDYAFTYLKKHAKKEPEIVHAIQQIANDSDHLYQAGAQQVIKKLKARQEKP